MRLQKEGICRLDTPTTWRFSRIHQNDGKARTSPRDGIYFEAAIVLRGIVHHIDGNKHNNHPSNLKIVTRAEHMREHGIGIPGMSLWWKPWEKEENVSNQRVFEDVPAKRAEVPLLLGIVGCSSSGKTFSALRLATGMQRVVGGEIYFVDTEHNRGLNYADMFKFRHVPFSPPFGSLDYLRAIEHCVNKGAKIIVIDSMTHEHSGQGGYLWEADQYVQKKTSGQSQDSAAKTAGKLSRTKWIVPAEHRKALINGIVQMGINGIFCFRASEKLDDDFKPLGWEPETTSKLIYELQQQFLLTQGCDGIPKFNDATATEKRLIKTPAQFRDWFKQGQRLDEDIGQRMAEWAAGKVSATQPRSEAEKGGGTASQPPSSKKSTFAESMYELKAADTATFSAALGREGYERIEDVPQSAQTQVYRQVKAEISERKAMQGA